MSIGDYYPSTPCVNLYESSGGQSLDWFCLGNKPDGTGFYAIIPLYPYLSSELLGKSIRSALLVLPERNYEGYRGSVDLPIQISRMVSAWSTSTKFNSPLTYDTDLVVTKTFNEAAPSASNYDEAYGAHGATWHYKKWSWQYHDVSGGYWAYTLVDSDVPYSSDKGDVFYDNATPYHNKYTFSYYSAASYDVYIKNRKIEIKSIIEKCINNGYTGLFLWFTLPGSNDNRKYFCYSEEEGIKPYLEITTDDAVLKVDIGSVIKMVSSPKIIVNGTIKQVVSAKEVVNGAIKTIF